MERAIVKFNKQKVRDINLEKICKDNNINFICIDGRKFKNKKLEQYIVNEIIEKLLKEKKNE
jgi:hypothetical protein